MRNYYLSFFILFLANSCLFAQEKSPQVQLSNETKECIDCHLSATPGIVADWQRSRHSKNSLSQAFQKPKLERRISVDKLPQDDYKNYAVGCYECHGRNVDKHKDKFNHFDFNINVIVSPNDCKTCHPVEVKEYSGSKKAHALDNLKKNPVYHSLVETITSVKEFKDGDIHMKGSSELTKGETCYACHGTEIKVEGTKIIESDLGEVEIPVLTNWPNQGVGRQNPDGSFGACTSCHPRHSFSIEIARKPYTCGQCHLEPDVPAFNVYKESKHGNIFDSKKNKWEWNAVPWKIGEDFQSPTCASCHNSLLTTLDGEVIADRSHDFGSRLWVRIFGLIYSHPQPIKGTTYEIKNADGLPLPTTFDGKLASEFLIDKKEQAIRKDKMTSVCKSCHATNLVESQINKLEKVCEETDEMVVASTQLMSDAWTKKIADNSNPFDEYLEILWQRQWLFYANSIRYATAMMGPDYAAFKNGWLEMSQNLQRIKEIIRMKSKN